MLQAKKVCYDAKTQIYKPVKAEDVAQVQDNDIDQMLVDYVPFVSKNNNLLCVDIDVKGINHSGFCSTASNYELLQQIFGIEDMLAEHYVEDSRSFGLHLFFLVPDGVINVEKLKTTNCKTQVDGKDCIYTVEIFYKTNRIIYSTSCLEYKNIKPIKKFDTTVKYVTQEQVDYLINFLDANKYQKESPTKISYTHVPNKTIYNNERVKFILDFYIEYCNKNLSELLNILNTDYYHFWLEICISLYNTTLSENNNIELYLYFCASIPYDSNNKKQYNEKEALKKWNSFEFYSKDKLTFATIESIFYSNFCLKNTKEELVKFETMKKEVIEETNFENDVIKDFCSRDSLFGLIFKFLFEEDNNLYFSYFTSIFCCTLVSQYTYEFRYTDRITMLNNYILLLAESGSGKNKYVSFVEKFAEQLDNIHKLSTPASRQGFYFDLCHTLTKNNVLISDEVLSKCLFLVDDNNNSEQQSFIADVCILYNETSLNGSRTKKIEDSCPKTIGTIFSHFGVGVYKQLPNFDFAAGGNRYICCLLEKKEEDKYVHVLEKDCNNVKIKESVKERTNKFLLSIRDRCSKIQNDNDCNYFLELIIKCDKYAEDKKAWENQEEIEAATSPKYKKRPFVSENHKYSLYSPKCKVWSKRKYYLKELCELADIDTNKLENYTDEYLIYAEDFLEIYFKFRSVKSTDLNKRCVEQAVRLTCVANIEKDYIPFLDFFKHMKILDNNNHVVNDYMSSKLKHQTPVTLEKIELYDKVCLHLDNKKISTSKRTDIIIACRFLNSKNIAEIEKELEEREIITTLEEKGKNGKKVVKWEINSVKLQEYVKKIKG
jgi:hypothetical protein